MSVWSDVLIGLAFVAGGRFTSGIVLEEAFI